MAGNKHDNGVHEQGTDETRMAYQEDTPGQSVEKYIEDRNKAYHEEAVEKKKKHFSQVFQNPLKGFPYNEEIEVKSINEKVEYVEYKFKNKRDAQKALDYFKKQNLIKLDINDDGLSQGELAIDAGKKDMTKYHKEVMKKFKPKVQTQEQLEEGDADASLKKKAEKTGISLGILKQVFQRGVKAWQSGHRPGTTAVQWGHARVNSFVTKSKGTWGGADKDLAKKAGG